MANKSALSSFERTSAILLDLTTFLAAPCPLLHPAYSRALTVRFRGRLYPPASEPRCRIHIQQPMSSLLEACAACVAPTIAPSAPNSLKMHYLSSVQVRAVTTVPEKTTTDNPSSIRDLEACLLSLLRPRSLCSSPISLLRCASIIWREGSVSIVDRCRWG